MTPPRPARQTGPATCSLHAFNFVCLRLMSCPLNLLIRDFRPPFPQPQGLPRGLPLHLPNPFSQPARAFLNLANPIPSPYASAASARGFLLVSLSKTLGPPASPPPSTDTFGPRRFRSRLATILPCDNEPYVPSGYRGLERCWVYTTSFIAGSHLSGFSAANLSGHRALLRLRVGRCPASGADDVAVTMIMKANPSVVSLVGPQRGVWA